MALKIFQHRYGRNQNSFGGAGSSQGRNAGQGGGRGYGGGIVFVQAVGIRYPTSQVSVVSTRFARNVGQRWLGSKAREDHSHCYFARV
jgi:hypothetical protein